jgi:rubrerythrin
MSIPKNEFDGALAILKTYHRGLVRQLAEEIIERREDFESPGCLGPAENIIDKYAHQLHRLCEVYSNLNKFAFREKPQGAEALAKDEFRCFSCGGVIRQADQSCPLCGWTWK